jgi:outer membrane protein insertion porin family
MRIMLRVTLFLYWTAGWLALAQQGTLAGLLVKPDNVIFVGNKSISAEDLRAIFRNAGTVTAQLSRENMDTYTPSRINHSLNMILAFYRNRGFVKAEITPPDIDFATTGSQANLQFIFKVNEDHAYSLGVIRISGAEALGQPLLVSLLNLQTKRPINLSKVNSGALAIQEVYLTLGYLDVDIKTRLEPLDDRKTADLVIDINEGKQYHLGKVELVGDSPVKGSLIREFLPFQSGDIFGKKGFDACLKFLNELGTTPELTSSDVTFNYDRTRAQVDVAINLEGKSKK